MAFKMNYGKGEFPFKKEKEYEPQTQNPKKEKTPQTKDPVDEIIPQTVLNKIEKGHRDGTYPATKERVEEIESFIKDNPGATHKDWYDWHFKNIEYKK